jgi:hypothetical protein
MSSTSPSLAQQAADAMHKLHSICLGFGNGSPPDGYSVLGIVNDLVYLRGKIGEEQARQFGGSQRAKLTRRIQEAKQHRAFRELKKTMAECEKEALLAVGEEIGKEIDAMELYELYSAVQSSLDQAIRFGISAASAVRKNES